MSLRTASQGLEGFGQQEKDLLRYDDILDVNERLRIEIAKLNQVRAGRQQTKCLECEQKEEELKNLRAEHELLKEQYENLKNKEQIEEVKNDEDFIEGPDRNSPKSRVRSDDRMAMTNQTTKKPSVARGRGRGMNRDFV